MTARKRYRVVIAFANLGRAKTVKPVRESLTLIVDRLMRFKVLTVLGLVEIDEGDKTRPRDHVLVRRTFTKGKGWRRGWQGSQEPIHWRNGVAKRSLAQRINVARSVKHWLPFRHLNTMVFPMGDGCPDLVVINSHYPITPKQHKGWRAVIAKAMAAAYKRQHRLETKLANQHHAAGRHVARCGDYNTGKRALLPGEVVAKRAGVDWITVRPAKGWHVHVEHTELVGLRIERFHSLILARVAFEKAA